jgi:hypothetical protein
MLDSDETVFEPRNRAERRVAESRCAPAGFTIEGAVAFSGYTRSRIYEEIAAGRLEARKAGRQTIILGDSLRAHIRGLPAANIRMSRKAEELETA